MWAAKEVKLTQGTNINEVNIFENGILNAFNITEAGGNSPLLNQIFNGLEHSRRGRGERDHAYRLAGDAPEHHAAGVPDQQQRGRLRQLPRVEYIRHRNPRRPTAERPISRPTSWWPIRNWEPPLWWVTSATPLIIRCRSKSTNAFRADFRCKAVMCAVRRWGVTTATRKMKSAAS